MISKYCSTHFRQVQWLKSKSFCCLKPDLTHIPEGREYYTKETKLNGFAPQSLPSAVFTYFQKSWRQHQSISIIRYPDKYQDKNQPTKKTQQGKISGIMDLILQGLNPWSRYWGVSSIAPMLKTKHIQKCTAKSEHLSTAPCRIKLKLAFQKRSVSLISSPPYNRENTLTTNWFI